MLLFFLLVAPTVSASEAAPSGGITLAASGLDNPRGFTWAPDSTLYVAQAGISPANGATATPTGGAVGFTGSLAGSVASIAQGCPVVYQGNLPSAGGTGGLDLGPASLAFLNG